ncbi:YhgE/Pip domain-containing protein [Microbacterium sp. X-17]|uniref:YhgE/Pip domain-containing protein n=1 Tax=Microbacterium sp. X-17 TaxID=3144404 RepID=UPI0031F50E51
MRFPVRIPHIIAAELRRLTSTRMSVIALVALVAVPVLYGGLYLWANQNPYGSLSAVPVALVVDDQGAQLNGQQRNIGQEVAQQLVAGRTFDWNEVDAATAAAGIDSGAYDFAVEIPADFTAAIASIGTSSPRQADIALRTNDASNYLASTIGTQAVTRIQTTVTQTVVNQAGLTLLNGLQTIRVQLQSAADGATQLADGLGQAATGSSTLASGAAQLAAGTQQLADGSSQLAGGAARVADGTARLDDAAQRIASAASSVVDALPTARADIVQALTDAGLSPAQIDTVLARLDAAAGDVRAVNGRVQDAAGQIATLDSGAQQVASGAASLSDGAAAAASGAAQVDSGAAQLNSALGQLRSGATQLRDGLDSGVDAIPNTDADTRAAQATTLADPVAVNASALTQAQNYGAGLAPFFAALAGWIGIYALFLIVKPVSRRAVTALHSPVRVTLAGWATPALLGGVQMTALFGVLALALGFSFVHPLATWGILLLASATYAAIILALNVWLGSVGQFLGLVLMVMQLVTAGGTFPWQTLPAPLAGLHHVLPMGFVVDALRQVMYGGSVARVWPDLIVLGVWALAAVVLSAVGVARMTRHRTLRDLQPSLIG